MKFLDELTQAEIYLKAWEEYSIMYFWEIVRANEENLFYRIINKEV